MAIAFVQKLGTEVTNTTSNATIAMTTTNAVAAGHYIVGCVSARLTTAAVATGISGGGLTWTIDKTEPGATAIGVSVFSAQAPSGLAAGTVITVTLSGTTSRKVLGLYEFSGVATSSPVGVSAAATGTTGNPAATLGSAASAGDLVFGGFQHNATGTSGTQTAFAGFTNLGSAVAGASSWSEGYGQYKVDASGTLDAGGYTPSVDTTTSWCAVLVCYHAAASSTTFPITITTGTVSLSASVQRTGKLIIPASASVTAALQRLGKLNITSSTVTTPVTVQRKGFLGIVTSTVTLPVTVAVQLVKLITIVTGTVSLSASVQRLGKLNILPTVSTPVTLIRKGLLLIKPTVAPTATVQRKGFLKITTGTVSATASVARKGFLGIVASTVSLPVTLVRMGLLLIKPTVTVTATDSLVFIAGSTGTPGIIYMNITVIGESANSSLITGVDP